MLYTVILLIRVTIIPLRTFLKDLSNNERVTLKLLAAAETVKHSLSIQQTAAVYIESLYDGMDFQCSITR